MDKIQPTRVVQTEEVLQATAKLDEITAPESQREVPSLTKEQEIEKLARTMFNGNMRQAEVYYNRKPDRHDETDTGASNLPSTTEAHLRLTEKMRRRSKDFPPTFIEMSQPKRDRE